MTTTPRIRASAVIIKNNQVLLIHRHKDTEEYWVFPGGGIDTGEDRLHAAIREVKEETSLDVVNVLDEQTYPDPDNPKFKHFFIVCEVGEAEAKIGYEEVDTRLKVDTFKLEWHNITDALKLEKLYPIPVKNHLRDLNHDTHRS